MSKSLEMQPQTRNCTLRTVKYRALHWRSPHEARHLSETTQLAQGFCGQGPIEASEVCKPVEGVVGSAWRVRVLQYLVFQPSPKGRVNRILKWFAGNTFEVNSVPGTYAYEWFDPSTHSVIQTGTITVGARHTFTAPLEGDAVLWLHR
jgi:hypothetical protein